MPLYLTEPLWGTVRAFATDTEDEMQLLSGLPWCWSPTGTIGSNALSRGSLRSTKAEPHRSAVHRMCRVLLLPYSIFVLCIGVL
jgi:hypothetical protein